MQGALVAGGPSRHGEIETPGEFFGGGGKIGIPHLTRFTKLRSKKCWRVAQCGGVRRSVELVEEVGQTSIEGVAFCGEDGDLSEGLWSHTLPSSNSPSMRYC